MDLRTDQMRSVPAPGRDDRARDWALAPTRNGGACGHTTRATFCGTDRESIESGRASVTEYPADEFVGTDPQTGNLLVKPSKGPGVRSGIAPSQAVEVRVLDGSGRVLRRETVARGVYEVAVPPQGTDARVAFVDASGDTIAERPAEG